MNWAGKMMVEFFSVAISAIVARFLAEEPQDAGRLNLLSHPV
jgi:hypothetical protein